MPFIFFLLLILLILFLIILLFILLLLILSIRWHILIPPAPSMFLHSWIPKYRAELGHVRVLSSNLMNELILSRNMLYLNGLIYSREHLHRKLCYFLMVFIHFSHAFTGNLWGASKFLGVTPAMAENLPRDRGFNCKAASFSNRFPRNLAIAATTAADAVNQKDHTCANYHRLSQYIIDRLGGCWKYMKIHEHSIS